MVHPRPSGEAEHAIVPADAVFAFLLCIGDGAAVILKSCCHAPPCVLHGVSPQNVGGQHCLQRPEQPQPHHLQAAGGRLPTQTHHQQQQLALNCCQHQQQQAREHNRAACRQRRQLLCGHHWCDQQQQHQCELHQCVADAGGPCWLRGGKGSAVKGSAGRGAGHQQVAADTGQGHV